MISINPSEISAQERYKLATGSVIPRPIALVSTISNDGIPNLSPFSFFTVAAYSPLVLAIFPLHYKTGTELKDTTKNLLQNGECVIHITTEDLAEKANVASGIYEYGKNEFEITGLTPLKSDMVKPFRVQQAPIQFEGKVYQHHKVGEGVGASDAFFIEVVKAHVHDEFMEDFKINPQKLKPVTRLAGMTWAKLGELFELQRPA